MCLCLFLNELLAVLDVDLSFDGSFHTTSGEVEDFCLIVVNGYALDAFGLTPTFVPARPVSLAVKLPYAFALYG